MMKYAVVFPDIHSHHGLFLRVHQFNLLPTRYIHASWLKDLGGTVAMDIRKIWEQNPRVEKHCAALIIKRFCQGFVYDFSDAIRRIVLMQNDELARLMVYAGLAICACSIRQTISGHHIRALRDAFGMDAYEFAVTRAPLLTGDYEFGNSPGNSPLDGPHGDPLPAHILESGKRCLEVCLKGSPDPLLKRLCLKFPRSMGWNFAPHGNAADRTVYRRIIQKIIKMEMNPQWQTVSA